MNERALVRRSKIKMYRMKLTFWKRKNGINKSKYGMTVKVGLFGLFFWKFLRYNRDFSFNTAQARASFLEHEFGIRFRKRK